jgi:hypothetical protein
MAKKLAQITGSTGLTFTPTGAAQGIGDAKTISTLTFKSAAYDKLVGNPPELIKAIDNTFSKSAQRVASPNDPRDEWLYDQRCKGVSLQALVSKLGRNRKGWEPIDTTGGITGAITRYCERSGKPRPPKFKRGRPAKKP